LNNGTHISLLKFHPKRFLPGENKFFRQEQKKEEGRLVFSVSVKGKRGGGKTKFKMILMDLGDYNLLMEIFQRKIRVNQKNFPPIFPM
jgi:hypothetical protein